MIIINYVYVWYNFQKKKFYFIIFSIFHNDEKIDLKN